jgi:hypothetical protein
MNSPVVCRAKFLIVIHNLCFVSSDGVYEIQRVSTVELPLQNIRPYVAGDM